MSTKAAAASVAPSIVAAFNLFDTDGDGSLSADELRQVLTRPGGGQPMSDDEVQALIGTAACSLCPLYSLAPPLKLSHLVPFSHALTATRFLLRLTSARHRCV